MSERYRFILAHSLKKNINAATEDVDYLSAGLIFRPKPQAPKTRTCLYFAMATVVESVLQMHEKSWRLDFDAISLKEFIVRELKIDESAYPNHIPNDHHLDTCRGYILEKMNIREDVVMHHIYGRPPDKDEFISFLKDNLIRFGPLLVSVTYNEKWKHHSSHKWKPVEPGDGQTSFDHAVALMGWSTYKGKAMWVIGDKVSLKELKLLYGFDAYNKLLGYIDAECDSQPGETMRIHLKKEKTRKLIFITLKPTSQSISLMDWKDVDHHNFLASFYPEVIRNSDHTWLFFAISRTIERWENGNWKGFNFKSVVDYSTRERHSDGKNSLWEIERSEIRLLNISLEELKLLFGFDAYDKLPDDIDA